MLSKSESTQLKGIAILVMIWLHTFNSHSGENYVPLFYWNGEPLAYQIGKITRICISLYAFLGGYGLYIAYQNNAQMNNRKRVLLLYFNFWFVFIWFIGLGCFLSPEKYPGSIEQFLYNLTGVKTSYCREWWFLFPYSILILFSEKIIRFVKYTHWSIVCSLTGIVYLTSNIILHFYPDLYANPLISNFLLCLSLLFSFALGMVFVKYNIQLYHPLHIYIKQKSIKLYFQGIIYGILMAFLISGSYVYSNRNFQSYFYVAICNYKL